MLKFCPHCGHYKPTEEFYLLITGSHSSWCRICAREESLEYNKTHIGKKRVKDKIYRIKNSEIISVKKKYYYKDNKEKRRQYYLDNKELLKNKRTEKYRKVRSIAIVKYGGKCECCGETNYEFLQIDHINGGGTKHRKEIGHGTSIFYWLKKNNYPDGFRILCANCNWSNGLWGYCPHKTIRIVSNG